MNFAGKAVNGIKAAKCLIKPMGAPSVATANEMRQEWAPVYKSDGNSEARARFWRNTAAKYDLPAPSATQWLATREG